MTKLGFRESNPEDVPEILSTLRLSLGETPILERTKELWHWKHTLNPFGRSIVLVAESAGTIAGVRALMRWQLVTPHAEVIECVRPVDTATHPDFVRRGIFRTLTMSAVDVAAADGVHLVFNTPNLQSGPGYLSMGWGHVGWIGVQVRPRLGRAVAVDDTTHPAIARWAPNAMRPQDIPPGGTQTFAGLATPRTSDYNNWRFARHPTARYGWIPNSHGGGAAVRASARRGRSELVISDLIPPMQAEAVRKAAEESRARYLAGWFSPGSARRAPSIRGGLIPVPGVRSLRLVAKPLVELSIDPFDLGSWDLGTSDLELL